MWHQGLSSPSPHSPQAAAGHSPRPSELTEVLEHVEVLALPVEGQPQDGVVLVVRVDDMDLPVACGASERGETVQNGTPGVGGLPSGDVQRQIHPFPSQHPTRP